MTLKTWFVSVATVGHATAARFAEVSVDDVHEAAEALGFGRRLTCSQVEEIIASFDEEEEVEPEGEDEDEEIDGDGDGEEDEEP